MNNKTKELSMVAVLTALIAATSWIAIPVLGVPVTLQTIVVMLMGLFLNVKNGVISIVAYLILGAIGLPVFASGMSGLGVLFGPTGGFLFSFIIAVIFVSIMKNVNFINNEIVRIVIILLLANVIIYFIGWTWFAIYTNTTLQRTLGIMSIYILGDLIKIVMVTYAYLNIRSYVTYERT